MICNTKTGCLVTGTLIKDAEYKTVGQNGTPLLKVCVRYGYEPAEAEGGRRKGKLIDVDIWGKDADVLNGTLLKGASIMAAGDLRVTQGDNGAEFRSIECRGDLMLGATALLDYIDAQLERMARLGGATQPAPKGGPAIIDPRSDDFAAIDDNEDLPF